MHVDKAYRKWVLTVSTGIMIFLANADFTIVNLALSSMAKHFNARLPQLQWVLTSYMIATVIFFIIGGRLADVFGKKRIFLFGTVLFTLSCLGAALAETLWQLDVMRFIQGMGFAFTLSLAILLNAEAFPKHQQGLSVGLSITLTGIGQAVGPTLGGAILQWSSWRWLFGYAVPLGLLSWILTIWSCHADQINRGAAKSFFSGLLDRKVWMNRAFLFVMLVRVLYMFSLAAVLFSLPLYLQDIRGLSPLYSGLMLLMMTAMIGILSPLIGYLMDKLGYWLPMLVATMLTVLSFASLSHISANIAMWHIGLMLFIFGTASGTMLTASVRGAMDTLPVQSKGMGMGIFFTVNFIMATIGVAIATLILSYGGGVHLNNSQALFSLRGFQIVIWVNLFVSALSLLICGISRPFIS